MVLLKKYGHYFYITGSRVDGNYSVYEVFNGKVTYFETKVQGNKKSGLREARILIARHLLNNNHSPDEFIPHYCNKPGRKKDAFDKYNASDYYNLLNS